MSFEELKEKILNISNLKESLNSNDYSKEKNSLIDRVIAKGFSDDECLELLGYFPLDVKIFDIKSQEDYDNFCQLMVKDGEW